ncbi:MAG: hypothetical protein M3083_14505 [Actinomycetota bacterium]|nr:hypothetical protein [Actinomycetota bacterium]
MGVDDTVALPQRLRRPPESRAAGPVVAPRRRLPGRRLRDPISAWRRIRSAIELLVATVILGVLLAAVVAAAVGAIILALQQALRG